MYDRTIMNDEIFNGESSTNKYSNLNTEFVLRTGKLSF